MLKDIENVQVVSFGWFNTWLNLNPAKIELMHILGGNCFEQVENTISSLFKRVCLAIRMEHYFGLTVDCWVIVEKKNHTFLWPQLEKNTHLCCPNECLATKGHCTISSGGQGACGDTPKARSSGELHVWPPKGARRNPIFNTVRFGFIMKIVYYTISLS